MTMDRSAGRGTRQCALSALVAAGIVTLSGGLVGAQPAHAAAPKCVPAADAVSSATPWPQRLLAADQAWPLSRGASQVIAVVDTGISAQASSLAGRVRPGIDVRTRKPADDDCAGHGTFLAGLSGSAPRAGEGFAGVAPDVTLVPIRVSDTIADVSPNVLAAGIEQGIAQGASVVAVGLTARATSAALNLAVADAKRHDVVVIAPAVSAAYHSGDVAGPAAPSGLPGVLSVGGSDKNGAPVTKPPLFRPQVSAPAVELAGPAPSGPGTTRGSGVGLAVGFVAGAAALVRAYYPHETAAGIVQRLSTTADLASIEAADGTLSSGIVNPVAAVGAVQSSTDTIPRAHAPNRDFAVHFPRPASTSARDTALLCSAGAAVAGLVTILGLWTASAARRRRHAT